MFKAMTATEGTVSKVLQLAQNILSWIASMINDQTSIWSVHMLWKRDLLRIFPHMRGADSQHYTVCQILMNYVCTAQKAIWTSDTRHSDLFTMSSVICPNSQLKFLTELQDTVKRRWVHSRQFHSDRLRIFSWSTDLGNNAQCPQSKSSD